MTVKTNHQHKWVFDKMATGMFCDYQYLHCEHCGEIKVNKWNWE